MTRVNDNKCAICHSNLIPTWQMVCDECMDEYKDAMGKELELYALAEEIEMAAHKASRKVRKYAVV